ncbi:MAG: NAD-dependent epimerase/dehydratase family protein, partial [Verrucomicrobiota bacterium]
MTGGGGFLGGRVARRLLEAGHRVRVFQRSACPELEALGAQVMQGNLCEARQVEDAVDGCEAVVHTAAKAGIWGRDADFQAINVGGTRHVVAACRAAGVRYLVHTSTPSVVFSGEAFRGADESLPYGDTRLSAYARTKAQAEREALAADDPAGLRVVALRPHLIYGPGDPHLLPRVVERARAGRLRIVGDGQNKVDITYIENAAQAHLDALAALEAGAAGGKAYFISDGRPVELWPWINGILERLDIPRIERRVPLRAAYAVGAVAETLWRSLPLKGEPPMTRFVATELAKDHWFDISAARRDLHYDPS